MYSAKQIERRADASCGAQKNTFNFIVKVV